MFEISSPLLFAHRGTRLMAPENTLPAFEFAERHQADVLETDVRLSADGEVIVMHDATLERTTDGTGRVRDRTLSELRTLDAAYRFQRAGQFPWRGRGVRLLTLDELFARFGHLGINIDIKDNDRAAVVAVARVLSRHVSSASDVSWINVGSFHQTAIDTFRACAPGISTAAGMKEVARLYFSALARRAVPLRGSLPFHCLQIPRRWNGIPLDGERFIRYAQESGLSVIYWTIDSPAAVSKLLQRGVDGIVTDRADLVSVVFQQAVQANR